MRGKLIVFEGTDGSGKATQSRLLCEHLEWEGIPCRKIDFPRYGKPSAVMIQEYLDGKLGKNPGDVSAYAATLFYAADRYASFKEDWGDFYTQGGLIVADRYTTSNAVHQASKLEGKERQEYLRWLFDLEYGRLALPEPDLVLYLDMPTEITERMMRHRESDTHTKADIHERDANYLRRCRESAREVVESCGWTILHCAKSGEPRSIGEIADEVWRRVAAVL